MRIYSRFEEAVKETERELFEMGTIVTPETMQDKDVKGDDNFTTKELQGYCFKITSNAGLDADFEHLEGNLLYAEAEILDRVSEDWRNPGHAHEFRPETWKEFLHNGKFAYTYNERFREQLPQIIQELKERPSTRQAVMTMYDRHQDMSNMGGRSRIPCSMYYQFLRRSRNGQEQLDAIYTMRSCDLYTHFIYDIWLGMKLQEYVAHAIGIEPGHFTYFAGSFHAYKKDYSKKGIF